MKILMLIVMFFVVGALFIISENKIDVKEEGLQEFSSLYMSWLGKIFDNTKSTVGYIVKMDWLPGNESKG